MNVKDTKIVESDETQSISQPLDKSRRSFAKKSAAIAPVIMTLANRSAWAGTNPCTESGFKSFTAPGAVHSHVVYVPNTNWKKPNGPNGWTDINSVWPSGYGRAEKQLSGKFTSPDLVWSGEIDLAALIALEPPTGTTKYLQNTTTGVTYFDALKPSDLLSYEIATGFNNILSPIPPSFLATNPDLPAYQAFYNNCV